MLGSGVAGPASLDKMAASLGWLAGNSMPRQSLHERFDFRSTAFLMAVLCDLIEQRFAMVPGEFERSLIRRVLIDDNPGQVMPKANFNTFPAHANQLSATAGVKIDLAFDLLSGSIISRGAHSRG
jgi:hypothetical protein